MILSQVVTFAGLEPGAYIHGKTGARLRELELLSGFGGLGRSIDEERRRTAAPCR